MNHVLSSILSDPNVSDAFKDGVKAGEAKHTPGPWTVEEYGDRDCPALVIHRDSINRVCFMATAGSHGDPAKIEADARLIAAAPELLEALRNLVEAKALKDVRMQVAGWNGEYLPTPYAERHPTKLGATLPVTNCGAVYELDEAMQRARAAVAKATGAQK